MVAKNTAVVIECGVCGCATWRRMQLYDVLSRSVKRGRWGPRSVIIKIEHKSCTSPKGQINMLQTMCSFSQLSRQVIYEETGALKMSFVYLSGDTKL